MKISKKILDKADDKFEKNLYFNKKKRQDIKISFLRLQKSILENVDPTIKPQTKEEYKDREFYTSFFDISIKGLNRVKEAEEFQLKITLKNCKFELYKAKKNNGLMIVNYFFKVYENKNKIKYIYLTNGLSFKGKKKIKLIERKPDLKNFELIDKGVFRQEIKNFKGFFLTYKGKIFKQKFFFQHIKGSPVNLWLTPL